MPDYGAGLPAESFGAGVGRRVRGRPNPTRPTGNLRRPRPSWSVTDVDDGGAPFLQGQSSHQASTHRHRPRCLLCWRSSRGGVRRHPVPVPRGFRLDRRRPTAVPPAEQRHRGCGADDRPSVSGRRAPVDQAVIGGAASGRDIVCRASPLRLDCSRHPSPSAAAIRVVEGSMTGPRWPASCSCSRPASPETPLPLAGRLHASDVLAATAGSVVVQARA
jgi:hypothetical protein